MTDAPRRRVPGGARGTVRVAVAAGCVAFLAVTFAGPRFLSLNDVVLAFTLFSYITMAQAWNLIGGFTGQFSLGHGMFVGVGAYATCVLLLHTSIPVAAVVPLSGLIAGAVGGIAAIPLIRLRGVYFSVGSLGLALAVQAWMVNWHFTGQTSGLNLPPEATQSFDTLYYLGAGMAVGSTAIAALLLRSRFGLRMLAVRDDERAAAELGVRPFTIKLGAFVTAAFLIGLAGSLIALQQLSIEPYSAFSLNWTIDMIIMAVIGGLASVPGPVIGALGIFVLQQELQSYEEWSTLIEGVLLVVVIRVFPGGLWAALRTLAGSIGSVLARA